MTDDHKREAANLQRQQEQNTQQGRERRDRIDRATRELENLDSQAGQQDKKLKNRSPDTWKAWEWVKAHRQDFEKPVFGPPIVECSVTDPQYVDMIETLFQKNSFLGFTVQTNGDFKLLQKQAHDHMHLSEINIKVIEAGLDKFPPPIDSDQLKRYGLHGWALDFVKGPEPVLAALCFELKLHRTAVSLQDTSAQQFDQLQNSAVDNWITSKSNYTITRRREYGPGATSTRVREVRKAQVWTDQPVDLTAKRELQENINGWNEEVASFQAMNHEAQTDIARLRDEIRAIEREIVCCV